MKYIAGLRLASSLDLLLAEQLLTMLSLTSGSPAHDRIRPQESREGNFRFRAWIGERMKIVRTLLLMAVWTVLYYLAGVFITSEWDTSEWDEAAKFVSLVFVWLPGIVVCGIAYIEVIMKDRP